MCLWCDDTVETELEFGADAAVVSVRLGKLSECTTVDSLNPQPCEKCSCLVQNMCLEASSGSEVGKA